MSRQSEDATEDVIYWALPEELRTDELAYEIAIMITQYGRTRTHSGHSTIVSSCLPLDARGGKIVRSIVDALIKEGCIFLPKVIVRLTDSFWRCHHHRLMLEYGGEIYCHISAQLHGIKFRSPEIASWLWLRRTKPWQGIFSCEFFTGIFGSPDEINSIIRQVEERRAWFDDPRDPSERGPCPPDPVRTKSGRLKRFRIRKKT